MSDARGDDDRTASGSPGGEASADAPDLTVVVVSYNTRELTLTCLESLYRESPELDLQVLVVDNASRDGSAGAIAERFPQVELLALDENLGFAAANNLAGERARAEWLLLLNPDTEVLRRGVERMLRFAGALGGPAVVGGRTYFADGRLNPTSCWGRSTLWSLFCAGSGLSSVFRRSTLFDPESLGRWPRDSVRDVDIVTGCLLLLPTALWRELGGFDLEFFMYGEDADLSLRAAAMGARVVVCPDAEVVHHAGASEQVRADKMVRLFTAKGQLFRKHLSPAKAWFAVRMLDAWSWSRMLFFRLAASTGRARARGSFETWREVWAMREHWRRGIPLRPPALSPHQQSAPPALPQKSAR